MNQCVRLSTPLFFVQQRSICICVILLLSATMVACQRTPPQNAPASDVSPESSSSVDNQQTGAAKRPDDAVQIDGLPAGDPVPNSRRPVAALHTRARTTMAAGDHVKAAELLERALRIDPRDAMSWHTLALVRFTQAQYREAIALAERSNSLTDRTNVLRAYNYDLLGDAWEGLGDKAQAQRFRTQRKSEFGG